MKILRKTGLGRKVAAAAVLLSSIFSPALLCADDGGDSGDSGDSGGGTGESGDSEGDVDSDDDESKKYESYYAAYEAALDAYDKAVEEGADQETLDALQARVDEAYEDLVQALEQDGYEVRGHNEKTGYVLVYSEKDTSKPAFHFGDPVALASGVYILSDSDLMIQAGKSVYSIARNYRSNSRTEEGVFGKGWSGNLDCRVVLGFSEDEISAVSALERVEKSRSSGGKVKISYADSLERLEEFFAEFVEQEGEVAVEGGPNYDDYLTKKRELEKRIEASRTIIARHDRAAANKSRTELGLYGVAGDFASRIGTDYLILNLDDGTPLICRETGEGEYEPRGNGYAGKLRVFADENSFRAEFSDSGEVRHFDRSGFLARIERKDGSRVNFTRSGRDISKIELETAAGGRRSLSLSMSSGRLESAGDGINSVSFGYDGSGRLSSVTDSDGDTRRFGYGDGGRLEVLWKADGSCVRIEYGSDGKVSSTTDECGNREKFSYDSEQKATLYTDHDGVESIFRYDGSGNTVYQEFSDGTRFSFDYNARNLLSRSSGTFGSQDFLYDDEGRVLCVRFSDGTEEKFEYSEAGLKSKTDRDGIRTDFTRDSDGNVTSVSVGGIQISQVEYRNGCLSRATDCFGNVRKYECDEFGSIVRSALFRNGETAPSCVEEWSYDRIGRLSSHKRPGGIVDRYEYRPRETKISSSDGIVRTLRYSSRKCLVSDEILDTRTGERREFTFEYDRSRRLTAKYVGGVDSSGKSVQPALLETRTYTKEGSLSRITEWNALSGEKSGYSTGFGYSDGILSRMDLSALGRDGAESGSGAWTEFSEGLVSGGRERLERRSDGIEVLSLYDSDSRLISASDPATGIEGVSARYSAGGRILSASTSGEGLIEFGYDGAGRLSGVREVDGARSTFSQREYFPNGKLKSLTDRLGGKTEYGYDEFGNQNLIRGSMGSVLMSYAPDGKILSRKILDKDGRRMALLEYSYSDGGRKVEVRRNGKILENAEYSAFGELLSETDALGNRTENRYDLLGRRIERIDSYGKSTRYEYNARNQVVQATYPDGSFRKFGYDIHGNLVSVSDSEGEVFRAEYDSSGRLVSRDERPFSSPEKYEYDGAGRLLRTVRNGVVLERYSYHDGGKTVVRTDSKGGASEFRTDGFSRVLSQKNRLGAGAFYSYDAEGRLAASTDFSGRSAKYTRAADGSGFRVDFSDGSFRRCEFDCAGRITLAETSGEGGAERLQYAYSDDGNLSEIYDSASGTRISYSYDAAGRLVGTKSRGGVTRDISYERGRKGEMLRIVDVLSDGDSKSVSEVDFAYDSMGREVLRHFKGGESVQSVYDGAGRLVLRVGYSAGLSPVFVEGSVYDSDGHLVLSLDENMEVTRYGYDGFGRLASVSYPYSGGMKSHLISLLDEAGVHPSDSEIDVRRLSLKSGELESLMDLCRKIGSGRLSVAANESVLTEKFSYDTEGNMTTRETPFGTISYRYDGENRLVSFGNGGAVSYDANGNMVVRKTAISTTRYEYSSENRMLRASGVAEDSSVFDIRYGYDFFGRRVLSNGSRTVYDGMGLQALFSTAENSLGGSKGRKDSGSRGTAQKASSSGRYIHISDDVAMTSSSRGASSDSCMASAPVYAQDGNLVCAASLGNSSGLSRSVLMPGLNGTVKAQVGEDGLSSSFRYDAFGSPENAAAAPRFGFVGKRYDRFSSSYDFGFRDYSASAARFTTEDPIRDGRNWYAYCSANPIDFVDVDGYRQALNNSDSEYADDDRYTVMDMNADGTNAVHVGADNSRGQLGNGGGVSGMGCAITATAEILSNVLGCDITPAMIAQNPDFFNENDELDFGKVGEAFGVNIETTKDNATKDDVKDFINSRLSEENEKEYSIAVKTGGLGERGEDSHYVTARGTVSEGKDGKSGTLTITPTSSGDRGSGWGRGAAGWGRDSKGNVTVPSDNNSRAIAASRQDCSK